MEPHRCCIRHRIYQRAHLGSRVQFVWVVRLVLLCSIKVLIQPTRRLTSNPRTDVAERSTPAGNASEQVQRAQGPSTHATRAPRWNPTNDAATSILTQSGGGITTSFMRRNMSKRVLAGLHRSMPWNRAAIICRPYFTRARQLYAVRSSASQIQGDWGRHSLI